MSEIGRRSGAPTETLPGRKTETDRVIEGISEGFRRVPIAPSYAMGDESERVAPRGPGANGSMAPPPMPSPSLFREPPPTALALTN